ncbi:TonB-dependent receptor [Marinihelvus fidelis]|uniref:TonB-dependent receptor n=1 Tax=Marinihelvus fidelis TaxID=2613842 RepID=A0A5N0TB06_9GAMM|nr:TonB-dependent receptor [Marinihelvus fidelis]KAA9131614.1 TonB-dependent receptor [Marinihelvus fidelis]
MFAKKTKQRHVGARLLVLASALAVGSTAYADALLRGRVNDADTERPLASAEVRIAELNRRVRTDSSGNFTLPNLPAGEYTLEVQSVGYEPTELVVTVPDAGSITENIGLNGYGVTEEVMVTGFRASQLDSVQDKNSADIIKDSIDANDAGKLPDQNAAEALRRVPGVSISIDQGEGRYVAVRGIDPGLNNVTMDGQTIGAPEADDRRIALDTIPADVLSKLEVIKTVTPDLDGNSIGGTVNLVTPSPYDDEDGFMIKGSADIGYYDMNGESPYSASAAYSQVFGSENQFGMLLSASYSLREYQSENVQTDIWEEEDGYYIPGEMVYRDYTLERERTGVVANFEWRPRDDFKVYFRNLFNEFADTEQRIETLYDYREGDLEDQTATSGTFTEGEGEKAYKKRLEEQSISQSTLGGEWLYGANTLSLSATFGHTEQKTPYDIEWSFEVSDSLPMSYDTSDFFPRVTAPGDFMDPSFFEFNQVDRNSQLVEEDLSIFQLDWRHDLDFGDNPGYIKTGLKFTGRDKTSDNTGPSYDGYEDDLLLSQFSVPGKEGFYDSVRPGFYPFGPIPDFAGWEGFFAQNEAGFELNSDDTNENEFAEDFTVTEDVYAAYIMAGVDIGDVTITGGVRFEETESEYGAYAVLFDDGDFDRAQPTRGSSRYDDVLPGIQARWQVTDGFVARAAWTNTIGRPGYIQLVPYRIFDFEPNDDDELEGEVEEGNPNLDRLQSENWDLSFEYYTESGGILAAGLFYKDIDNPIFSRSQTFENINYEGREFAELEITRPENAEAGELLGLELNWQQQFLFLPGFMSGFGASVNYTYTDSEATVFDRDDKLPFFLQSTDVANAALYWERSGLELRLAWTYRSEYLDEVGGDPEEDLYVDDHSQVDFKASYAIGDHFDVYFEARNLTDEPLRYISGKDSGRLAENEIYGWNATLGLQFNY